MAFPPQPLALTPSQQRIQEIVLSPLKGYLCYWGLRLAVKLEMLKDDAGVLYPLPYVLVSVISAGLVETARLTYDLGLSILGDRNKYENLSDVKNASAFDLLRQKTWKVVTCVEKIPHDVDALFSHIFQIRSIQEIQNKALPNHELDLTEIVRKAFCEQVHETIQTVIPWELGVYAVEAMGYTILEGHLFWLHGVFFFVGVGSKIREIYSSMPKEEMEEGEFENNVNCDSLVPTHPNAYLVVE